jgi:hypothetical protein
MALFDERTKNGSERRACQERMGTMSTSGVAGDLARPSGEGSPRYGAVMRKRPGEVRSGGRYEAADRIPRTLRTSSIGSKGL